MIGTWLSAETHKSIADIWARRARSLMVVIGVALATAGLVAVTVAGIGLSSAYTYTLRQHGPGADLTIAFDHVDQTMLDAASTVANVVAVQDATTLTTDWQVAAAPGHVSLSIVGYTDFTQVHLDRFELLEGRYPSDGEIALEYADRALQSFSVGDRVHVATAQGVAELTVAGVVRTSGINPAISGKAMGYMSRAALVALPAYSFHVGEALQQPLRADQLAFQLRTPAEFAATADAVASLAAAHDSTVLAVTAPERGSTLHQLEGIVALARVLIAAAMIVVSLLVSNTVTSMIAEQVAVIGVLKTLGATRWRATRGYLVSVALICAAACTIGTASGVVLGRQLTVRMASSIPLAVGPFTVPAKVILFGIAAGFVLPMLFALVPLWLGTRITVRDALAAWGGPRSLRAVPGVGRLRRGRPGTLTMWLTLRSMLRRPWKATQSLATVATVAVCFFVVQSTSDATNHAISAVWANFDADVEVYTSAPRAQLTSLLAPVANIDTVEPADWVGAQTAWGKIALWGVLPGSKLYRPHLVSGRWFTSGDDSVIVIGEQLAARSHLRAGARVTLAGPDGHTQATWTVIGTVHESIDDLSQIGSAIAPVTQLSALRQAESPNPVQVVNRLLVRAQGRSPGEVDKLTRAIDRIGRESAPLGRDGPIREVFAFRDEVVRHQRSFTPIYVLLVATAIVVGLVGSISLANMIGTSVVEHRRDVGVLRVIGGTGRRIATIFWIEAVAYALAAWLAAAIVGLPLAQRFVVLFSRRVMPITFRFGPVGFAVMLAAAIIVATLASIVPAMRAASLRPADSLRDP